MISVLLHHRSIENSLLFVCLCLADSVICNRHPHGSSFFPDVAQKRNSRKAEQKNCNNWMRQVGVHRNKRKWLKKRSKRNRFNTYTSKPFVG